MFHITEISTGCAKGLLIVLNMLCILLAVCTFGFAVVDLQILRQYGTEQANGCYTGDVIIVVATVLMIAVAIVGCVGTVRDSVKMLYLYIGFVLIMVILELLITIFVLVQRYGLQFRMTEWIREDFYRNLTEFDMEEHVRTWEMMHMSYECCGLNGPDDFITLGQRIPLSCCPRAYTARSETARDLMYKSCVESVTYFKAGCEDEIVYMLQSDADFLIGVAAITFLFEAMGILLAMWITRQLLNSVQVYKNTVQY